MKRTYDIFEKLPDGSSIWRACVPGKFDAQRKLQELAEHSDNEFFAIDLKSREYLLFDVPPRKLGERIECRKRVA